MNKEDSKKINDDYEEKPTFNHQQSKSIVIFIIAVILIIYLLFGVFGIRMIKIDGTSMTPGLKNRSIVITEKLVGSSQTNYKRGSRIVFYSDGVDPRSNQDRSEKYVKRIIGVPGDKINYKKGIVYINGKPENEVIKTKFKTDQNQSDTKPLVTGGPDYSSWNLGTLSERKLYGTNINYWNKYSIGKDEVPKDCYFVMGDHRSVSNDSREFGYVPAKSIVGKVIFHINF